MGSCISGSKISPIIDSKSISETSTSNTESEYPLVESLLWSISTPVSRAKKFISDEILQPLTEKDLAAKIPLKKGPILISLPIERNSNFVSIVRINIPVDEFITLEILLEHIYSFYNLERLNELQVEQISDIKDDFGYVPDAIEKYNDGKPIYWIDLIGGLTWWNKLKFNEETGDYRLYLMSLEDI